jgi:hypothetical protein
VCDNLCPVLSGAADLDVLPGTQYEYTITGLNAGTRYYARIREQNTQGFSKPSLVVNEIPRSPPSAPREVSLVLVAGSDSSLQLYWRNPATHNGNTLMHYKVEWRRSDVASEWMSEERVAVLFASIRAETNDIFAYTIIGLLPGIPYTARVSADNNRGYSPVTVCSPLSERPRTSAVTIAYNSVWVAPRVADDVVTVMDSVSTLVVTWQPPADFRGDVVDSYVVETALQPFTSAREDRQVIVQTSGVAIGGTFRVLFQGEATDYLANDISAADMKIAVDGLVGVRTTR